MALNKVEIINLIRELPYDTSTFWLVMGSALVMWDIKEATNDIDMGCTEELFDCLLCQGFTYKISKTGRKRIDYNEQIHFYLEWPVNNLIYIEDIQVSDISSILSDKKNFNRQKDLYDIILIQEYLNGDRN